MAVKDIRVIEFHNGKPMHSYDGLQECATAFHCHMELIKGLIYTGQPFPYLEGSITFDIHPACNCRIVRGRAEPSTDGNGRKKARKYYTFDIVSNNDEEGEEGESMRGGEEGKSCRS